MLGEVNAEKPSASDLIHRLPRKTFSKKHTITCKIFFKNVNNVEKKSSRPTSQSDLTLFNTYFQHNHWMWGDFFSFPKDKSIWLERNLLRAEIGISVTIYFIFNIFLLDKTLKKKRTDSTQIFYLDL